MKKTICKKRVSLYNFTYDSMISFLHLIDYDTNNKDKLIKIWKATMMIGI